MIDWNETNVKAATLLHRVGLRENPVTKIIDIGVGKQQLVEIAKALSKDVKLLILDEPTAALNDEDSAHLLDLIGGLRDHGITSIIISHKLNEIKAIADPVTIIRDGRTIETLDLAATMSPRSGSSAAWSAATWTTASPSARRRSARRSSRIEDWTVHHPLDQHAQVVDNANLHVRRRRGRRHRRTDGGRTDRAGDERVRPLVRHTTSPATCTRTASRSRPGRSSRRSSNGIAYATEDRKRYGLNLIDDIKRNISAAALGKLARGGVVDANGERWWPTGTGRACGSRRPSWRRSPASCPAATSRRWCCQQVDVHRPGRADPGRAHPRHRRRRQVRDLHDHQRAGRQGKAIIVISSELPELLGICDRIYALSAGRITGEVDDR